MLKALQSSKVVVQWKWKRVINKRRIKDRNTYRTNKRRGDSLITLSTITASQFLLYILKTHSSDSNCLQLSWSRNISVESCKQNYHNGKSYFRDTDPPVLILAWTDKSRCSCSLFCFSIVSLDILVWEWGYSVRPWAISVRIVERSPAGQRTSPGCYLPIITNSRSSNWIQRTPVGVGGDGGIFESLFVAYWAEVSVNQNICQEFCKNWRFESKPWETNWVSRFIGWICDFHTPRGII